MPEFWALRTSVIGSAVVSVRRRFDDRWEGLVLVDLLSQDGGAMRNLQFVDVASFSVPFFSSSRAGVSPCTVGATIQLI
jgi:hypothetical protein